MLCWTRWSIFSWRGRNDCVSDSIPVWEAVFHCFQMICGEFIQLHSSSESFPRQKFSLCDTHKSCWEKQGKVLPCTRQKISLSSSSSWKTSDWKTGHFSLNLCYLEHRRTNWAKKENPVGKGHCKCIPCACVSASACVCVNGCGRSCKVIWGVRRLERSNINARPFTTSRVFATATGVGFQPDRLLHEFTFILTAKKKIYAFILKSYAVSPPRNYQIIDLSEKQNFYKIRFKAKSGFWFFSFKRERHVLAAAARLGLENITA